MMRVSALYVDVRRGPYASMPDVEAWGEEEDARTYTGPWPVVAHPPCGHWGRYAHRCRQPGRDLAPLAVQQVRRWGGILEHPAQSRLWWACGLPRPGEPPDMAGGWTIEIEQGWWGHPAPKKTWLYVVGWTLPLPAVRPSATGRVEGLAATRRHLTPPALAAWLVGSARLSGPAP